MTNIRADIHSALWTLGGKATWVWDDELSCHIPCCSRWKVDGGGSVIRCGNGPLHDPEIGEGTCTEGPHLPRRDQEI